MLSVVNCRGPKDLASFPSLNPAYNFHVNVNVK